MPPTNWRGVISRIFLDWLHLSHHNKISTKQTLISLIHLPRPYDYEDARYSCFPVSNSLTSLLLSRSARLHVFCCLHLLLLFQSSQGLIEQWSKTSRAQHFSQTIKKKIKFSLFCTRSTENSVVCLTNTHRHHIKTFRSICTLWFLLLDSLVKKKNRKIKMLSFKLFFFLHLYVSQKSPQATIPSRHVLFLLLLGSSSCSSSQQFRLINAFKAFYNQFHVCN